jgi:hypothetical protein
LLAITPTLAEGASAGFSVILPGGRQEIVAWIRDYEAEFADTYWLESPIVLPRGSRLRVEAASSECLVTLTIGVNRDFDRPSEATKQEGQEVRSKASF